VACSSHVGGWRAPARVQLPWFLPISPEGGSGCPPEVPDGRQLSGHTPRPMVLCHRQIARNGVHRRPEIVGKCCVSSSDRPASPPSAIASQPHAHDCITTGRPANPPHLRSLSHGHPWCSFASWGWCLAVVLSRTPIFASGAQHPPLTLVPRGGRAGLLRIPGRSVLLSGAHTTTLGV